MVCEFSQPKKGPCENGPWLRNNFAAPKRRCENRFLLRNGFATSYPPLRKFLQLQSDPLAHKCHFVAPNTHFTTAKWLRTSLWHTSDISQRRTPVLQLRNGLRKCYKNGPLCKICLPLRNYPLAAKMNSVPWHPFKRYKFHFFYSNRSFVLQKGTKRS